MNPEQTILEILKTIPEPESEKDIVSLGMVREVRVRDGYGYVHLELARNEEGVREYFKKQILEKTKGLSGIKEVSVEFSRIKNPAQSFVPPQPRSGVKYVMAVGSGKGGVGKTTVAVNLALALKQLGHRVGLMDADIYGPNVPLMLGIGSDQRPQIGVNEEILPLQVHGISMISMGILVPADQPVIWRGPKLHGIISQFVQRVGWGELDYLLVDLPPGTGDVQLSLVQSVALSGAVMVTTPQEVALMDVRKGIAMFQKTDVPILGIIENMTGEVFGRGGGREAAVKLGVPFLGDIPLDAKVRVGGDTGEPVVLEHPGADAAKAFMHAAKILSKAV